MPSKYPASRSPSIFLENLGRSKGQGQETADVDEETNIEDVLVKKKEYDRIQVINQISEVIGLCHPICYDVHDLCEYRKGNKLSKFNNDMLKDSCAFWGNHQ